MQRRLRTVLLVAVLAAVALASTGCILGSSVEIFAFDRGEGLTDVSVSATTDIALCVTNGSGIFTCEYYFVGPSGERLISSAFVLSDIELALLLFLLDPLVIQLPDSAHDFAGSYLHTESGEGGDLAITSGLDTLPIDADRSFTAEPGTQIVVIELPEGAPTTGEFAVNFNFAVPDTLTSLEMKPLFTGRVDTVLGDTFYLPLLPCVMDMASVPPVSVPLPAGGQVSLPVASVEGCDGEVYAMTPTQATDSIYLPLVRWPAP